MLKFQIDDFRFQIDFGLSNCSSPICNQSEIINLKSKISRIQPVEHPRIRDRLPDMLEFADPAHDAFHAHAETAVRYRAVAAQIEIPLECVLRQVVLLDAP